MGTSCQTAVIFIVLSSACVSLLTWYFTRVITNEKKHGPAKNHVVRRINGAKPQDNTITGAKI